MTEAPATFPQDLPPDFQPPPSELEQSAAIQDYWGTEETVKHVLPDGVQWFEIKPMNEGARAQFQQMTNTDMVFDQRNQSARMRLDAAKDRHQLIKTSVVGWNLYIKDPQLNKMVPQPWGGAKGLDSWLQKAPPKIVDDLEYAIRMANPWMQSEMTVEATDEEINRLLQLKEQLLEKELGEDSSANK